MNIKSEYMQSHCKLIKEEVELTLNSVHYPEKSMTTESIMEDCDSTRHYNCKVRSDAGGYDWTKCPFSGRTAAQIQQALA
jgi:hypothetical protein